MIHFQRSDGIASHTDETPSPEQHVSQKYILQIQKKHQSSENERTFKCQQIYISCPCHGGKEVVLAKQQLPFHGEEPITVSKHPSAQLMAA